MSRRSLLLAIAFGLFPWAAGESLAAEPRLRAGAAQADITPRAWPVDMVGSFSRRLATKAWDPLHARAIVLDDGATRLAIVVIDSCYVPRNVLDDAKRRASKATGIRAEAMLMSATHTHSAPPSRDRRESLGIEADSKYVEHLTRGIAKAVTQANANLEPSEIGRGVVQVPEEVFNRRWFMKEGGIVPNPFGQTTDRVRMNPPRGSKLLDRPAGPTDPDVAFVSVRSVAGRPIALLANYSLHYVGGIPPGGVSADYFGEFCRLVKQRLAPKDGDHPPFVALLSNGTSGDINNINFRNPRPRAKPLERMRQVAKRVADAVLEKHSQTKHRRDVTLAMAQRLLTLNKRKPSPAQIKRAKEFVAAKDASALPPRAKPYARWVLELAEPPRTEEIILQAVRIGDVGITAIPCEVFVEIGLELKAKSPMNHHFTIELANGHNAYLPTPRQHALGGYETWMGTCRLETTASEKITEVLLELMQEVSPSADAPAGPRCVAHRGLLLDAPENTLANFRACLGLRHGFELDVRRTKDGHLVCIHDETVDRTTDGKGRVADLTLRELKRLDAGAWFDPAFRGQRVPTLDEVFSLIAKANVPNALIAVDLKGDDGPIEEDFVRLARTWDVLEQLLFIGRAIRHEDVRRRLREADANVPVACLANDPKEFPAALKDPWSNWVYVRYVPSAEEVAQVHRASKRVFLAGPAVAGLERENWSKAALNGVDAILTDHPLQLARQRRAGKE